MNEQYKQLAEILLFAYGKAVLGKNGGGMVAKLKNARGILGAYHAIKAAEGKHDPREYIGAAMKDPRISDVTVGETIDGWIWDGGKWKRLEAAE